MCHFGWGHSFQVLFIFKTNFGGVFYFILYFRNKIRFCVNRLYFCMHYSYSILPYKQWFVASLINSLVPNTQGHFPNSKPDFKAASLRPFRLGGFLCLCIIATAKHDLILIPLLFNILYHPVNMFPQTQKAVFLFPVISAEHANFSKIQCSFDFVSREKHF